MSENVARRGFLIGGLGGAALLAAGCTSNEPSAAPTSEAAPAATQAAAGGNDEPGTKVTIGFSAPAAAHGWIAAIAKNAEATAQQYSDIEFKPVEPTNDINQQISAVESLIAAKVDALVILPNDGEQLNQIALRASEAGIPVVNLDRIFPDKLAYRTWICGVNYGVGVPAGRFSGTALKEKYVSNPVIVEIQRIPTLPPTQDLRNRFADALKTYGFSVTAQQ